MRRSWPRLLLSVAFVAVLAAALTAVNLDFTRSSAGGTDFLARWLGTRLYITERQNPYGPETTLAIQEGFYGRPALQDEDQAFFAYPFYSMLFFAPFSLVGDYPLARALWITAQEAALVGTAFAAMALSGWRPGRWALAAFLLFALIWLHGAKPLIDGNASILVGLLATLALLALRRGRDGWAGIALALSTIKPHIVVLLIVFVLAWALSHKRRGVLWSFVATLALLCGVSFALQPGWLLQNLAQMLMYGGYTPPGTLVGALTEWLGESGRWVGLAVSAALGLLLFYEWVSAQGGDFEWFLWTASVTIAIGPLIGVATTSSNYTIFLPVLALLFAWWQRRTGGQQAAWFIMAALFAGLWALFLSTLTEKQFNEHPVVMFVAPVFLLLNLYWLRWWLLRPRPARTLRSAA
jgi:hypothetical protein